MAEHQKLRLPLFTSLRGYDRGWLRGDVIAYRASRPHGAVLGQVPGRPGQ